MLKRYFLNSAANIFSGAVAAVYQLTITAMAVATWVDANFAAWGLAMSIAVIAPILSANLSSVITRRLVQARHGLSETVETAITLAGRHISWGLAILAFVALLCAGALIQIRPVTGSLTTSKFLFLLVVLLSTNSWLILWQVRFGQYYAEERNWPPALILACARGGGMLGMFIVLELGSQNLIAVALGLFAGTCIALAATKLVLPGPRQTAGEGSLPTTLEVRNQFWRNLSVLYGFAFGAASSLIIQFSIPPLIAFFEPQHFNAFYVASTVNAVVVSILSAAMLALLAPFARWHATGSAQAVRHIALLSPALCAGACLIALSGFWFALETVLGKLTNHSVDNNDVRLFIALLGFQTIVRTSAAGFATYVSSTGTSRQMATPLVIEMVLAVTVAIPLGWIFGVHALLLGLTLAGLVGSQFASKILISLHKPDQITAYAASASLITAQLVGSALWWWIVSASVLATK